MNTARRAKIATARQLLVDALAIIESCAGEERDALDNMPEALQDSDRGVRLDAAAEELETAAEVVEDTLSRLDEAVAA